MGCPGTLISHNRCINGPCYLCQASNPFYWLLYIFQPIGFHGANGPDRLTGIRITLVGIDADIYLRAYSLSPLPENFNVPLEVNPYLDFDRPDPFRKDLDTFSNRLLYRQKSDRVGHMN